VLDPPPPNREPTVSFLLIGFWMSKFPDYLRLAYSIAVGT